MTVKKKNMITVNKEENQNHKMKKNMITVKKKMMIVKKKIIIAKKKMIIVKKENNSIQTKVY